MKHIISLAISVFFTFAMFACGKSSKSTEGIPIAVKREEIQSENKKQAAQPLAIIDSQVRINDNYELQIFASNNWYKFKTALPKIDLTEQEFAMATASNLNAKLKCLDRRCSKSEINVQSSSSQHQLHIEQLKVIPVGGEFLKNCELPLFFDYEFDELTGDNAELKNELKSFTKIDQLEITSARIGTLTESNEEIGVRQRMHFKFSSGRRIFLTADSSSLERQNISLMQTMPHHRYLKKVSINSVGSSTERSFDWVRFHFPLNNGNEICYHMSVIPKVL